MKFSKRSKRFDIIRRSAVIVFALISMTLFFQFNSGVEVHATTKTEFNDTEINRETSEQLKMIDPYLVAVELGHHIFDPCSKFIANLIGLTLEFSQN